MKKRMFSSISSFGYLSIILQFQLNQNFGYAFIFYEVLFRAWMNAFK